MASVRSRRLTALLILATSCVGCASDGSPDHEFPGFDPHFPTYHAAVRDWVEQRSLTGRSKAEIELNLPFELSADEHVPYRGRFLLLHGLNDSPYVWHDYAHELASMGFDTRAILFAGHGTTPVDMLDVHWKSWLYSARQHLQSLQEGNSPVFIGGFSMGAVIATWLALDNPDVAGLFLVSPAYDSKLNHYLRWSGIYARFRPWVFGGMILEDNPIKYNSIPVNSGWQYFQLTRGLKKRWRWRERLKVPTLMVLSEDDSVVDTGYTKALFKRRVVAKQRLLIHYKSSIATEETVRASLSLRESSDELIRSSRFLQNRILSQSHLGLMYATENKLFGENGTVLVCNGNEYPVFSACMRARNHWYGAQHTPSPDGVAVARTTFNPDWSTVIDELKRLFAN